MEIDLQELLRALPQDRRREAGYGAWSGLSYGACKPDFFLAWKELSVTGMILFRVIEAGAVAIVLRRTDFRGCQSSSPGCKECPADYFSTFF